METGRGCTVGSAGGVTGKSERRFRKSRRITENFGIPAMSKYIRTPLEHGAGIRP